MKKARVTEWTGRICGLIISGFFIALLSGEAMDGFFKNGRASLSNFLPLLALAIAGCLLAWFKPRIGGAFAILGGMLMLDFHLLREDLLTASVYGVPFIFVGALFMVSAQLVDPPKKNIS